jgi:hypothetical protein
MRSVPGPPAFAEKYLQLMEGARVSQFFLPRNEDARALKFLKDYRELTGQNADYGAAFA